MRASCKGCKYLMTLSPSWPNTEKYCNYMLETGEKRGCPPEKCTRKEIGTIDRRSHSMRYNWLENYTDV